MASSVRLLPSSAHQRSRSMRKPCRTHSRSTFSVCTARPAGESRLAPKGQLSPAQLRNVLELIHEHLASKLTLRRLATCSGYSPFQFARLFRATTGFPPHAFVLRLRLERACRLLQKSKSSPAG